MSVRRGDDLTRYPIMPQYPDILTMHVWPDQGVEEHDDDGEDDEDMKE